MSRHLKLSLVRLSSVKLGLAKRIELVLLPTGLLEHSKVAELSAQVHLLAALHHCALLQTLKALSLNHKCDLVVNKAVKFR